MPLCPDSAKAMPVSGPAGDPRDQPAAPRAADWLSLAAARAIDLYELQQLRPEMRDIIGLISEAARVTNEAIPLLRDVSRNGAKLHQLTERLVRLEGKADDVHAAGLKRAFRESAKEDPLQFAVTREILRHLERVTDAFEDVANQIDGIVIDHA